MCTGPHAFIPAENVAELRAIYDTPGGKAMNVTNWQKDTPFSKDDLAELILEYETAWNTYFSPLQGLGVAITRFVATDINSEDSFQVDKAPSLDLTGLINNPVMPGNVTAASKLTTGHTGRSYRGRSYFIGLTEGQCVGDSLASGVASAITAAWDFLIADLHADVLAADLCIVSYCADGSWRTNALVNKVTAVNTEGTLDSMRTRLLGRGI